MRLSRFTVQPKGFYAVGTAIIVLVAALLRVIALGRPSTLVFDETYYVKDAYALWQLGFEAKWPADANALFEAGAVNSFLPDAAFVVHPQVGKWMIAWGLAVGGPENPWAWRLSNAIIGVLAVWLVIAVARRLFNSTYIALIAGLLMAIDGTAIVHSRIGLLDQFLMFFVLAAFYALLRDREQHLTLLSANAYPRHFAITPLRCEARNPDQTATVQIGKHPVRWWRILAGVLLGLACGVKWSGAYFLAGFGVLTVLWDLLPYRTMAQYCGLPFRRIVPLWLHDVVAAFLSLVPVALIAYLASWFSWFITPGSWGRDWAANNPGQGITWLPPLLRSFVNYQSQVWTFHTGLSDPHPYSSPARQWLLQIRPTAFFWGTAADFPNYSGCAQLNDCAMSVNSVGNPIIWWLATLAIVITIWFGILLRDWRALAVLSGIAFGWLPWLLYPDRTTFAFYSIAFLPWMILTLCYAFNLLQRGRWGRLAIAVILTAIVAISIAFYPVWTALPIERAHWHRLIWLHSWI